MNTIYQIPNCTGCRSCEIACSFYHYKKFNPYLSSIEIEKDENSIVKARLFFKAIGERLPCDGCKNAEEKQCVKFCSIVCREELNKIVELHLKSGL